jgi:hypothetical protein
MVVVVVEAEDHQLDKMVGQVVVQVMVVQVPLNQVELAQQDKVMLVEHQLDKQVQVV